MSDISATATQTNSHDSAYDTSHLREKAAVARDAVSDLAGELRHFAGDRIHRVKDRAVDSLRSGNDAVVDMIRDNPYRSLAIAAGAGFVLGMLLKRR